jgi:hypothetical protein
MEYSLPVTNRTAAQGNIDRDLEMLHIQTGQICTCQNGAHVTAEVVQLREVVAKKEAAAEEQKVKCKKLEDKVTYRPIRLVDSLASISYAIESWFKGVDSWSEGVESWSEEMDSWSEVFALLQFIGIPVDPGTRGPGNPGNAQAKCQVDTDRTCARRVHPSVCLGPLDAVS